MVVEQLAPLWDYTFSLGPEWLVSALVTFVLHETFYFGAYLPFFLADFVPALRRYKIQRNKDNTWTVQWKCLRWILFLHFCIEFPLMFITHPLLVALGMNISSASFPSVASMAIKVVAFYVIEDFYFYWVHRLLHYGDFYKRIHKIHHDHAAPFGITAEYAHPVETVFLGIGTILGPLMFADHLLTLWFWLFFRVLQTVEVHSGYDFPWSLNNWVPYWGGAEFHDFHHKEFIGNYSSTFTVWDHVFGTDDKYLAAKARNAKKAQ